MNWALENYNIANDARSKGPAKAPILYLEDGSEIELATRLAICDVCHGKGHHVNVAIDAGGLSEEMMEDEEFLDGYQSGVYDVPCNHCGGDGEILEVDFGAALSPEHRALYKKQLRDEWGDEQERLAEI